MANGVNKVFLIGNLGQEPEVKYTSAGKAVVNLSVATSDSWKDKSTGERQERTEWHRVTAFDRLAEICGEYLHKGSKVYIEGSLRTRKWQDKNGADRYTTEIAAREMRMLDSRQDGGQQQGQQQSQDYPQQAQQQARQQAQQQAAPPAQAQQGATAEADFDDDIPF